MNVDISKAQAEDLAEVMALLHRVNLPDDGVTHHFRHFLIARTDNKIVGCVGLEIYGEAALLRSLAVAPEQQKTGLGKQLTERVLELARAEGVRDVVLLTTTATEFFQRIFNFVPAVRAVYDEAFAASAEWHLPRCSSAACLHRQL